MRPVVDLRQLRGGQLRVALRSGETLVAEQFLNSAQVRAFLQQMRSEGVAQRVRMHISRKAAQNGDAFHDAADAARGQPRLPAGLARPRNCRLMNSAGVAFLRRFSFQRRLRPAAPTAPRDRRAWRSPPRLPAALALLLAFAAHQDRFVGPVDVVKVQSRQLGVADAASVKHFEDGLVARRPTSSAFVNRIHAWFIASMLGTRGRCLGRRGVATSEAAFCSTWPARASHLNQLRIAASARAAEAFESPCS